MTHFDDETLAAFVDGELDAAQTSAINEALARDPALRARLQELRNLDDLLRTAVAPAVDVPDRFATLLKPTADVVQLRPQRRTQAWMPVAGTAIAAGAAFLMFGAQLTATGGWLRHVDDGLAISGALETAALTTPSGQLAKAGDLNVRPIMSFVANDGRECRELHVRDKEMAARMLACRDAHHDEWCIEALTNVPVNEFPDNYKTAGVKKDPVIDAAYVRLGVKETLDESAENAAIARQWKPR
jgi:hypothetical protein